jgi:exodeoxyribonuclease VII small subunit
LEQSIELYERGAALKAHCEKRLEAARLRVEKIVVGPQGPVGVEPAEFS